MPQPVGDGEISLHKTMKHYEVKFQKQSASEAEAGPQNEGTQDELTYW